MKVLVYAGALTQDHKRKINDTAASVNAQVVYVDSVEEITESQSIRYLDEGKHLYETRYDEINNILVAIEMNDEKTTIELLERFYKTEYAMKRHFQPL